MLDFLRRTDLRCDSGLSVDDSWLGAVLYICDTLVLDGRIDDVMAILDRCAEVGDKARIAGDEIQGQKANPFRDDVPFLKALLARRRLS